MLLKNYFEFVAHNKILFTFFVKMLRLFLFFCIAIIGIYDDACNETASLGHAVDLVHNNNIIAFIGPACSDDLQVKVYLTNTLMIACRL
jgi:hypothetical protein